MPKLACGQFALLFSESLFHHRTRLNTDMIATELPECWCHFCVLFGLDLPISPSHWCLCVSVSQHTVVTTVPMETASFTFHFQHQSSLYANHSSGWQQIRSKDLSESTQGSWRLTGHRHTSTQPECDLPLWPCSLIVAKLRKVTDSDNSCIVLFPCFQRATRFHS